MAGREAGVRDQRFVREAELVHPLRLSRHGVRLTPIAQGRGMHQVCHHMGKTHVIHQYKRVKQVWK